MPSKNMLPKGSRRRSVRAEYRATRGVEAQPDAVVPELDLDEDAEGGVAEGVRRFAADAAAAGMRLDAYLAKAIPEISRARVQLLIEAGQVRVEGETAKGKQRLRGGEAIEIEGEPRPVPLSATPEDIPLDILYEDKYLAVVNKPAGMMVHAGAGNGDEARSRGTLVNALLHHMSAEGSMSAERSMSAEGSMVRAAGLSGIGGELRPGIVHRLDKQTSGAIVVAKDDVTHRKLGEMFATRRVAKTYLALVHGNLPKDHVTVNLPIARDVVRRTRMTTRRTEGRSAVSHIKVVERLATPYGAFTLVEVRIETGRTHQIRVHMQSLGHPVVGDTLYGAPRSIPLAAREEAPERPTEESSLGLQRNFLHAAHLEFAHPQTGNALAVDAPLPPELEEFLARLKDGASVS
jgi:23S rRNA pseudouridine1911/1915/1917 synthase